MYWAFYGTGRGPLCDDPEYTTNNDLEGRSHRDENPHLGYTVAASQNATKFFIDGEDVNGG